MKTELLDLETDFANNEYFGTNLWTEEKYRVLSGDVPILFSAPHSVNQIRGEDVRDAEKFTGALVRYLSSLSNCYGIFQMFTHADPNTGEEHNYKNAIINLISVYNIKMLIDIHSADFKDDTNIDIVTNQRTSLCGMETLVDKLRILGIKHNVKVDENNVPNKEKDNEIIGVTSLLCGIPSIRIVFNNKYLDPNSSNCNIENICLVLKEFIEYFNGINM